MAASSIPRLAVGSLLDHPVTGDVCRTAPRRQHSQSRWEDVVAWISDLAWRSWPAARASARSFGARSIRPTHPCGSPDRRAPLGEQRSPLGRFQLGPTARVAKLTRPAGWRRNRLPFDRARQGPPHGQLAIQPSARCRRRPQICSHPAAADATSGSKHLTSQAGTRESGAISSANDIG